MSAREKGLVLKTWVRFLKNGFRLADFSDRLYKHLTLHCSFIAHYNRVGFHQTYFEDERIRSGSSPSSTSAGNAARSNMAALCGCGGSTRMSIEP
jgi:hypothetical protein